MTLRETVTGIADTLRRYTATENKMRLAEMPQQIENACTSERQAGYNEGAAAEKQAAYDRFWDTYQSNGTRTDYRCGFGGEGWNADIFKPKYDIKPTNGYMMFRYNLAQIDLAALLEQRGIVLDTANMTQGNYMFQNSMFTRIGVIDFRNCPSLPYAFDSCPFLVTIDCVKLMDDGSQDIATAFTSIRYLENITIEGRIGSNVSFRQSTKLTKASIESIVTALSDTATGKTLTLSKTAVDNAFAEVQEDGTVIPGSQGNEWLLGWVEYKPNWTISLV